VRGLQASAFTTTLIRDHQAPHGHPPLERLFLKTYREAILAIAERHGASNVRVTVT
jgi:hypothetical protein